jgi:hypothetical protein
LFKTRLFLFNPGKEGKEDQGKERKEGFGNRAALRFKLFQQQEATKEAIC